MTHKTPRWIPLSPQLVAQLRAADPEYQAAQHDDTGHHATQSTEKTCVRCDMPCDLVVRGLCDTCYRGCKRRGQLSRYPRTNRPTTEVIDEYNSLRAQGLTPSEVAATLGMTPDALQRAVVRARVAGTDVAA